jgi:hypothetical protein
MPNLTSIDAWRDWAVADAKRRGLPELAPLLEGLAATIARLRAGDWNEDFGSSRTKDGSRDEGR